MSQVGDRHELVRATGRMVLRTMRLHLRPATLADRDEIYSWLARSDATAEMMGPPRFSDHPVPSYQAFCDDYDTTAFAASEPFRIYVMETAGLGIGAISSYTRERVTEIDLWIGDRAHWGKGYGSRAIRQLAGSLFAGGTTDMLVIRPSARNKRAVAAYHKAGFAPFDAAVHTVPDWVLSEGFDYDDAVVLVWPRDGH